MLHGCDGLQRPLRPDQLLLGGGPVTDFVQGVDVAEAQGTLCFGLVGAADVHDVADQVVDVLYLAEEALVGVVVCGKADPRLGNVDDQVGGLEGDWEGLAFQTDGISEVMFKGDKMICGQY